MFRTNAASLDAKHNRFWNRVRVFAYLILEVGAVFPHLVGIDGASVLEKNDFRAGACGTEN